MIIIQIEYFWKIGKFLFDKNNMCLNITEKISGFLSYYYGNSSTFSIENINLMKKFYLYFPIYSKYIERINWDCYRRLLILSKKECYFYYKIVLFCNSDKSDLESMIENSIFLRI